MDGCTAEVAAGGRKRVEGAGVVWCGAVHGLCTKEGVAVSKRRWSLASLRRKAVLRRGQAGGSLLEKQRRVGD